MTQKISLIVAMDEAGGIGKNNALLCHLPADLKYFNYAIDETKIAELYSNGFKKTKATIKDDKEDRYLMVTNTEMENNEIKEL